jgi:branched-chain amino acid transport system permease protein
MAIPVSIDGLVMVLLGGVHTVLGPLVGALAFTGLRIGIAAETDFWRVLLGGLILATVLAFPKGIAGFLKDRLMRPER